MKQYDRTLIPSHTFPKCSTVLSFLPMLFPKVLPYSLQALFFFKHMRVHRITPSRYALHTAVQIFTHTFTLVLLPCTAPAAGTTSLADFLQKKALYLETRASFPLAPALIPSALSHLKFYFLNIIQCYRRWQTFRLSLNQAIIIRQPPCKAT